MTATIVHLADFDTANRRLLEALDVLTEAYHDASPALASAIREVKKLNRGCSPKGPRGVTREAAVAMATTSATALAGATYVQPDYKVVLDQLVAVLAKDEQ